MTLSAEAHVDLVRSEARRAHRHTHGRIEFDELVSMGAEGLMEAIARFDDRRSVPFAAYARLRIRGRILDDLGAITGVPRRAMRHGRRHRTSWRRMSLDDPRVHARLREQVESVRVAIAEGVDTVRATRALRRLSVEDAFILSALYLEGRTLTEVGAILGVTASWVSRKRNRALAQLRDRLRWDADCGEIVQTAA